ncbi:hypothetical protein B0H17DRAFT_943361 [Mycena rosella]|uniref:Uncharacterized protein n=1 Tax=Mycena rosella TaxID=1033263 RepID=A0AAD7GC12_MYCRO|nr:hypothetical protein B0H17DRAFT_943361 [Mycena rosella]
MYSPGYMDDSLVYGRGGVECYNQYQTAVTSLLERSHAVAFIAASGLLSFIAQMYDKDLVNRFVSGPSAQVTNFTAGRMLLVEKEGIEAFYTADKYVPTEVDVLIGKISTGNPNSDCLLWPDLSLLEEISDHYHEAWTPGCYNKLENLKNRIIEKKQYVWRMQKQWIQCLLRGNKGAFATKYIPADEDFEEGMELICHSFPKDWQNSEVATIVFPEEFDPRM